MKTTNLFIITGFSLVIFCCKNPEKVQTIYPVENQVANDTTWEHEQKVLGDWLMSQPQEFRDAFKRDFTFSKQAIDSLGGTIQDTIQDTIRIH
jgi:hypothetical protein